MAQRIVADVSKFDRTIDWPLAVADGRISGVIIRYLIGFEGDAFFSMNAMHVNELGIPWSPYFTIVPGFLLSQQMEYVHAVLHGIGWKAEGYLIPPSLDLPGGVLNRMWVDCEDTDLSRASTASYIKAYLDAAEAHISSGHTTPDTLPGQARPGIYTNQAFWSTYVGYQSWAKRHKLWVSNPGSIHPAMPPGWEEPGYELFQYTWDGDVPGFPRRPKSDLSRPNVVVPPGQDIPYRVVVGGNLRTGPFTSRPIIRYLSIGERVSWAGETAGSAPDIWWRVKDSIGNEGWMWKASDKLSRL